MDSAIGKCDGPQMSDNKPKPTTSAAPPNIPASKRHTIRDASEVEKPAPVMKIVKQRTLRM